MPKSKIELENHLDGNKEILFDLMIQHGFEKFEIYFDGQGDDGQVNDIEATPSRNLDSFLSKIVEGARIKNNLGWANGQRSYKWQPNPTVKDIVYDICYNVLEGKFGGWENDNGSCGYFLVSAAKRKVELVMKQRYYEYDVTEYTF